MEKERLNLSQRFVMGDDCYPDCFYYDDLDVETCLTLLFKRCKLNLEQLQYAKDILGDSLFSRIKKELEKEE